MTALELKDSTLHCARNRRGESWRHTLDEPYLWNAAAAFMEGFFVFFFVKMKFRRDEDGSGGSPRRNQSLVGQRKKDAVWKEAVLLAGSVAESQRSRFISSLE